MAVSFGICNELAYATSYKSIYIGANAVVNKDIDEPNSVVVGIPAKVIKTDSIHWWEKNRLIR